MSVPASTDTNQSNYVINYVNEKLLQYYREISSLIISAALKRLTARIAELLYIHITYIVTEVRIQAYDALFRARKSEIETETEIMIIIIIIINTLRMSRFALDIIRSYRRVCRVQERPAMHHRGGASSHADLREFL